MHTEPYARRQALCLYQQGWERGGKPFRFFAGAVPILVATRVSQMQCRICHLDPSPAPAKSGPELQICLAEAVDHLRNRGAFGTGREIQRHAMAQDRMRERQYVINGRREATLK